MTLKRRIAGVIAIVGTLLGSTVCSIAPAHAGIIGSACHYPGGGAFGADLTGWLPDMGIGPFPTLQPDIYDVVGYTSLPAGCATGELDLAAYTLEGTAGTCTLVLPSPVITGAGCDDLLGDAGAGVATSRPFGFKLTVVAELIAAGTDGSSVDRTATCSGYLDKFDFPSFRCSL